ncbi:MAG: PVC-type heme-binding CxxCH protein [Pirellulales bacterium]
MKQIAPVFLMALTAMIGPGRIAAAPPELPDGTAAAVKQISTMRVPEGMKVELFAAEPKLASPVAIGVDERNRVFVAEEYRFNLGTEENRTRPFLLEDDLQLQTLDDRLRMYEKWAGQFEGGMDWFRQVADQVRLVEDTDGDGRADRSTVFAPGFNGTLDGLAAGVMAVNGNVYFTCIPNLWRLRDTDGDGIADERTVVHTGFGVNAGFLGHDLHGLCFGPDGKLYFSVGDRGYHLHTHEDQTLHGPRTGAVFRCYPDGSQLEVVMRGLRNPQEIAFDQWGNLFAADNNCDKGDHSRLVYVLEGGDSGWNMAFQSLPEPYLTGPWHAEQMWHLPVQPAPSDPAPPDFSATVAAAQRPAWLLPPVGKLGAGPSGFAYYPGVGLPPRYHNHFFLCNYTGNNGGIEAFGVQPRGAGFEIVDEHDVLKPLSATDCEFGYDGKLYISDFVNLIWNGGSAGGRLFTLFDTRHIHDAVVKQSTELFRNGFEELSADKLLESLHHPDMRVRQRAQFSLAARGSSSVVSLSSVVKESEHHLARLHALWGLGQIAARPVETVEPAAVEWRQTRQAILALLHRLADDQDLEVRAHSARLLGDLRDATAVGLLVARLNDDSPRVRMMAALSLGKLRQPDAMPAIVEMLRANNNADPWLRHAGVMALAGIGDQYALAALQDDSLPAVRLAALLSLRKIILKSQQRWPASQPDIVPKFEPTAEEIRPFTRALQDSDWQVAAEAARAINDLPLDLALPDLAALPLLGSAGVVPPEAVIRRVIHANFRLGGPEHARRVAALAVSAEMPLTVRQEAMSALVDWNAPGPRDRVTGFWRPVPPRDAAMQQVVTNMLTEQVAALLAATSAELQADLVKLIEKHKLPTDDEVFASWVRDPQRHSRTRGAALRLLATRDSPQVAAALAAALSSDSAWLRAESRDVLAQRDPIAAIPALQQTLASDSAETLERQRAVAALAAIKMEKADQTLAEWSNRLRAGQVPEALQLDVLDAASARGTPELRQIADEFRASLKAAGPLAAYRLSLHGGDAEAGRAIFVEHRVGQCLRCHKVGGSLQGGNAGPDLQEAAKRHDRAALLQSLIEPSAKIAKGFETVTLVLQDGTTVGGVIKQEEANQLTIAQPDGTLLTVKLDEIDERTAARSAMPEMNRALSPRELRDLVEFLTTLK